MGGGGAQYVTTAGQLADFTLREFPRGNSHEPWRGLGTGCRDQRRPRQKTGSCGPGTLGRLLSARGTSGPSPASSSQASSLRADEAQDRPRGLWWPLGGQSPDPGSTGPYCCKAWPWAPKSCCPQCSTTKHSPSRKELVQLPKPMRQVRSQKSYGGNMWISLRWEPGVGIQRGEQQWGEEWSEGRISQREGAWAETGCI